MKKSRIVPFRYLVLAVLLASSPLRSQAVTTAVPFLRITTSTESNGMGGLTYALPGSDPSLFFTNVGLVGYNSLVTNLAASFYPSKTEWLGFTQITLDNYSFAGGAELGQYFSTTIPVGIGFGYNYTRLNLGEFVTQPPQSQTVDAWEDVKTYSIGIGIQEFAKVGFGYGWSTVRSKLVLFDTSGLNNPATARARRWGIFIQVPVGTLLRQEETPGNIKITSNLNFGYALNNVGDGITYADALQIDPLPRMAGLGYSIDFSLDVRTEDGLFPFAKLTYGHEAEDLLVQKDALGNWKYTSGLPDIRFFDNVFLGQSNSSIVQRTGWEILAFGFLSYREGRWDGGGYSPPITTEGVGVSGSIIFQLLHIALKDEISAFVADHLDLRYNRARYSAYGPLSGTKFEAMIIRIR